MQCRQKNLTVDNYFELTTRFEFKFSGRRSVKRASRPGSGFFLGFTVRNEFCECILRNRCAVLSEMLLVDSGFVCKYCCLCVNLLFSIVKNCEVFAIGIVVYSL